MTPTPDAIERYLKRLGSALADADPQERDEIVSDIRSLILEQSEALGEGSDVAPILERLGSPEALADAYRTEGLIARAAHSTAPLVIVRAALGIAAHGVFGFLTALVVFLGYTSALGCLMIAVLKPIFPAQVGLWVGGGQFVFGFVHGKEALGAHEVLGYWAIPVGVLAGLLSFVLTSRLARWFMGEHVRRKSLTAR